jgi:hypothetical protein
MSKAMAESLKRPKRPGPEASLAEIWTWMEELETYHQTQVIEAASRHPESAEDRLTRLHHEMEETTTRHQLEALEKVTPHPPMPPYKPK